MTRSNLMVNSYQFFLTLGWFSEPDIWGFLLSLCIKISLCQKSFQDKFCILSAETFPIFRIVYTVLWIDEKVKFLGTMRRTVIYILMMVNLTRSKLEKFQFKVAMIESDEMRKTRNGSSWKPDFVTRCIIDRLPNLFHLKLFSTI